MFSFTLVAIASKLVVSSLFMYIGIVIDNAIIAIATIPKKIIIFFFSYVTAPYDYTILYTRMFKSILTMKF